MRKTLLVVALSVVLALLLAGVALADPSYDLYVNGVGLNEDNCYWENDNSYGDESDWNARWDHESRTLILQNADIKAVVTNNGGIYCESGDLTISLKGDNTITVPGGVDAKGIYLTNAGNLTLRGGGSLEISISGNNDGIYVDQGDLVINDGVDITITAGGDGLKLMDGNVDIDNAVLDINADADGIYVANGSVDIWETDLDIIAGATGINVSNSSVRLNDCDVDTISSEDGCGIHGLSVFLLGTTAQEISSIGGPATAGIYADQFLVIDSSDLEEVTGRYYGIYCGGYIEIYYSTVNAEAAFKATDTNPDYPSYACAIFSGHVDGLDDPGIELDGTTIREGGDIVPVLYSDRVDGASIDTASGELSGNFGAEDPTLAGWTFSEFDQAQTDSSFTNDFLQIWDASALVRLEAASDLSDYAFALPLLAGGKSFPFVDVPAGHWAYQYIFDAYKQNLINGVSATLYAPDGSLTYGEAVKLAACIHQLQTVGSVTTAAQAGDDWYAPYVAYAELNGIIKQGQFAGKYDSPITRYDFAYIFSQAMPDGYYTPLHQISSIADVPAGNAYYAYVLKLYKAGILNGSDAAGNFNGASSIKRCEVAAIVMRMVDDSQRL